MGSKCNFNRFLLLWAGELVSSVGGGLTGFGLGVYVFEQTGSTASMVLAVYPIKAVRSPENGITTADESAHDEKIESYSNSVFIT